MNKKQVVKVKLGGEEMYGICLNENRVLLENGRLADTNGFISEPFFKCSVMSNKIEEKNERGKTINIDISNTRNVPSAVRDILNAAYDAYNRALSLIDKINPLLEQLGWERNTLEKMPVAIQKADGFLLPHEFEQMFLRSLSGEVARIVKDCEEQKVGYHSCPEPFEAEISFRGNELYLSRHILIEKYFRNGSFVYEMYDGEIALTRDAKNDPNYQKILKEYSSPLPVKNYPYQEYLSVGGDKGFLTYHIEYEIPLTKPLTEEYAKALAKAFSEDRVLDKPKKKHKDMER